MSGLPFPIFFFLFWSQLLQLDPRSLAWEGAGLLQFLKSHLQGLTEEIPAVDTEIMGGAGDPSVEVGQFLDGSLNW